MTRLLKGEIILNNITNVSAVEEMLTTNDSNLQFLKIKNTRCLEFAMKMQRVNFLRLTKLIF